MPATVTHRPERRKNPWRVTLSRPGLPRKYDHCPTEAEARALAKHLNDLQAGVDLWLEDDGLLLTATALRGWHETYKPTFSPAYEKTALGLVERHLIPHFGHVSLPSISQAHMLAFVEACYQGKKSGALALNALSILRRVCQLYVEAGVLDRNPCARVGSLVAQVSRRHESAVQRADAWTRSEVALLLELARKHEKHVHGPLLCALHTGMRRGEILGLEWADVGPRTITVRRAWVRGKSRVPKSGKAREVPISAALMALFDGMRPKAARTFADIGPVFQPANGGHWDEANFGRAWRRLQKLAVAEKVRPLRFHDARHTFASWALEAGRSIKWCQERLGHSSAELTLRTYSHLMPGGDDEMGFLDLDTKLVQTGTRLLGVVADEAAGN
jgi:integrase